MKTETKKLILEFIQKLGLASPNQISIEFGISKVAVHKQLKDHLNKNKIRKVGKPPKVFYEVVETQPKSVEAFLDKEVETFIQQNYLLITPDGKLLYGLDGFNFYSQKLKLDLEKTAIEYYQICKKYNKYKNSKGIINASFKVKETFGEQAYLDKLFYFDFYSIERFGKTILAQLTFQGKQSQDKFLISKIVEMTKDKIYYLLLDQKIEAIGFVPPSVDRKIQFQREYEKLLNLPLPKLFLDKLVYDTPVQQKTLKKLEDRILNADKTISISSISQYLNFSNVLLIDDFVGSGATLNQIAKKLKSKGLAQNVYGLAITGSLKGFEVINQV